MKLTINHLTHYRYDEEVKFSTQYLRLTPQSSARQHIRDWKLTLPASAVATTDAYGNLMHVLTLDHPHHDILIHAQGVVEIADNAEEMQEEDDGLSPLVFLRGTALTEADEAIRNFARRYYQEADPIGSLETLMAELQLKMPYTPGATQVQDTACVAFAKGRGVCQDHTHVFLACCRSRRVISAVTSIAGIPRTSLCMPGPRCGSMNAGTVLISPIIPASSISICALRWGWIIWMPARCAAAAWVAGVKRCFQKRQ